MSLRGILIVLASGLCLASLARAEGLKPNLPGQSLVTPILVDQVTETRAWVFPNDDPARFWIEAGPLLEVTERYLPESTQANLKKLVTPEHVISEKSLELVGIHLKLDESTLNLNLDIPPKIRKQGEVELVGMTPSGQKIIGPAPFSGYLNGLVSESVTYPANSAASAINPTLRQPVTSQLNSVMNYRGWDLEAAGNYAEKSATLPSAVWQRTDTHLVHDIEDSMMRFTAGDLPLVTRGFQSSVPVAGISATRDFTIQPYRTTRPVNRTQIFLNRPSIVEVFINGGFVQRLQLPAGPVDFKDFPLASGRNDLTVRVTDDLGQTETIHLSLLFDAQLLSVGLNQFSYDVGFPSTLTTTNRTYDTSNFVASAFHRVGVTDTITLGANFQRDKYTNLFGAEEVWTVPIGTFYSDIATSLSTYNPTGFGYHTQYRSPEHMPWGPSGLLITGDSQYLSPSFAPIGVITPSNNYAWLQDIYASQEIFTDGRVGVGYRYEWGRDGTPDQQQVMSDLNWNWTRSLQTGVNYTFTTDTAPEHRAYITLTWTDDPGLTQVYASVDTQSEIQRVDVHRQPVRPYDDIRFSGGAQHDPTDNEADLHAQYLGNHAQLNLDHQSTLPHSGNGPATSTTGVTLGVAVAWAGDSIGITRPINDSFAIISDTNATGIKIPVNDNGVYSETIVNSFGPGIVPDLLSYYNRPMNMNSSVLPDGYKMDPEHSVARPSYHSGVRIPLHVEAFIAIKGYLIDRDGKPIGLASGEIWPVGGTQAVAGSFFTNSRGGFFFEGLKPGKYEIRVFDGQWLPIPFEIQKQGAGIVNVGTLSAERKAQ